MLSAGEDLDDIFEDPESRENEEATGTENNEQSNNETTGLKIQPPKRIIRNPRLKFNPERLCGERGIPILVDHFKNVKFKGKGHEEEDLDKLLSKLEHWTHRLFPSMKFEDCLHHIEKLGKKRPVQTCLRKIRLNMPILNNDFVKEDEEDNVQRNEDSEPVEIDAFDRLVGESQNVNPITSAESMMDSDSLSIYSFVQRDSPPESRGQVLGSFGSCLTEEQKERLERNKMLAIERRKAKLAAVQENNMESTLVSNEKPASDEGFIAQSFDSLFNNRENKFDDLLISNSHCNTNERVEHISLNDPNSDNLGLDDLIHLVEEEELASDKNLTVSSSDQCAVVCNSSQKKIANEDELSEDSNVEINNSNLEQSMSCSILDETKSNITIPCKVLEANESGENLGLESLMDLVNENSEEYQDHLDPSCVVKDTLMHHVMKI